MNDMECPPLPPTRMYHRGAQIDHRGRVSALCFSPARAIDMKRATWTMRDEAVTCPKCKALILARSKTPNVGAKRAAEGGPLERPVRPHPPEASK